MLSNFGLVPGRSCSSNTFSLTYIYDIVNVHARVISVSSAEVFSLESPYIYIYILHGHGLLVKLILLKSSLSLRKRQE